MCREIYDILNAPSFATISIVHEQIAITSFPSLARFLLPPVPLQIVCGREEGGHSIDIMRLSLLPKLVFSQNRFCTSSI